MFEKEAEKYATVDLPDGYTKIDYQKKADWQKGAEFGYNKAFVEADKNLKAIVTDFNKANEWHNLNENYKDLPNEGEWVEGLYIWYYKGEPHWDVFKVRWYYEIGILDEKLVRWYSCDEYNTYNRDYWNKVDEPDYWRKITLPMRNEYDRNH